jgi:fucose permease
MGDWCIMQIVPKRFQSLYASFFAVFTLFGISMMIVAATLPKILADFKWNYSTAGLVMASGAVGYFVSTWLAGKILPFLGPRNALAIGIGLDAIGLALFAAGPSPILNFILYFGIGLGQGFLEVTVNSSVLRMSTADGAEHGGRAMSLMHGAFAIGAVAGPFVIGWILAAGLPWVVICRIIAAVLAVLFVTLFFLPFKELGRGRRAPGNDAIAMSQDDSELSGLAERSKRSKSTNRDLVYWMGFVSLLLYVGVELGISNWSAEYFVAVFGVSPAVGSFMVSLFWMGLLAGRLCLPLLGKRFSQSRILFSIATLLVVASSLLSISGFLGAAFIVPAYILEFLAGLGCSGIYPIIMSIVGEAFPHSQEKAIGMAATGGGIGSFVFPYVMSLIANSLGIRFGFVLYAIFAVAVLISSKVIVGAAARRRG